MPRCRPAADTVERIVYTSIPKCGTHLLLGYFHCCGFRHAGPYGALSWSPALLDYIRNLQPGDFTAWHYAHTEQVVSAVRQGGAKVVFLYCDPRAQVVSRTRFIMKTPHHPLYRLYAEHLETWEQRLCQTIRGLTRAEVDFCHGLIDHIPDTDDQRICRSGVIRQFQAFEGWLTAPDCFCVRFEDVIGPRGGGDRQVQLRVTEALMAFTGTGPEADAVLTSPEAVADALFDATAATFRKGQIGAWRKEFPPVAEEVFMEVYGDKLSLWGYSA